MTAILTRNQDDLADFKMFVHTHAETPEGANYKEPHSELQACNPVARNQNI